MKSIWERHSKGIQKAFKPRPGGHRLQGLLNEGRLSSKAVHQGDHGSAERSGPDRQGASAGSLGHVCQPISGHAESRPGQWLEPLQRHGEPLQPALPGGRERPSRRQIWPSLTPCKKRQSDTTFQWPSHSPAAGQRRCFTDHWRPPKPGISTMRRLR